MSLRKIQAKLGHDKKDEVLDAARSEVTEVNRHCNLIAALGN